MCANLISDPASTNLNLSLRLKSEELVTSSLMEKTRGHRGLSSLTFDSSLPILALANTTTPLSICKMISSHTRNANHNKSTTNRSYSRWLALRWEDNSKGTRQDCRKTNLRCQAQLITKVRRVFTIEFGRKTILTCWYHHEASGTRTTHSPA